MPKERNVLSLVDKDTLATVNKYASILENGDIPALIDREALVLANGDALVPTG